MPVLKEKMKYFQHFFLQGHLKAATAISLLACIPAYFRKITGLFIFCFNISLNDFLARWHGFGNNNGVNKFYNF